MNNNYRWIIVSLAFLGGMISYIDRSAISYAIKPLQETFGLDDGQFGLIAAVFGIGYAGMCFIGGALLDRFGVRKVWSIAAISWSLVCAGMSFSAGFTSLLMFRFFLGVAEGPGFPAMSTTMSKWLPRDELAKALGAGLLAVPVSMAIGSPIIANLIVVTGWRTTFVILGLLGIVWGAAWYKFSSNHPQQSSRLSPRELKLIEQGQLHVNKNCTMSWKEFFSHPTLIANNYAFFVFAYVLYFSINWLPGYFQQTYAINLKATGWWLMIPWITAAVLMTICSMLSDSLWKKTKSLRISRSHLIWPCQLISAIAFLCCPYATTVPMAILCMSFGIGFAFMPNAIFSAVNVDIVHGKVGASLGLMIGIGALSGVIAPWMTGALVSFFGNFNVAIILMAGLSFSSMLVMLFFHG